MAEPRALACCPICDKPVAAAHRPFCGPRCADIDLGRWLTGHYVVPSKPEELDEDVPPETGPA